MCDVPSIAVFCSENYYNIIIIIIIIIRIHPVVVAINEIQTGQTVKHDTTMLNSFESSESSSGNFFYKSLKNISTFAT
jgi:hypothetical protein